MGFSNGVHYGDRQVSAASEACHTKQVGRQELDDMRALKTVLSHLLSRIGRIKRELEEILDDDQDMLDMYIGRRADEVAACQGDLECIDRLTHNPGARSRY